MVKKSEAKKLTGIEAKNKLHDYREELALSKVDLARLAKLSDKTIARVERSQQQFRSVTYRKIFNALNKVRREQGLQDLTYDEVYPGDKGGPRAA